jgi:hypothetical protein
MEREAVGRPVHGKKVFDGAPRGGRKMVRLAQGREHACLKAHRPRAFFIFLFLFFSFFFLFETILVLSFLEKN